MRVLTVVEVRVLGALIEKSLTTPDIYPLSLNALVNACNQKSSREPVMELAEADVRSALFEMEALALVRVLADARVSKFEHRAYNTLGLGRAEIAVVCLLALRGPQTAAELRARSDRMYSFDDTAAVTTALERLAARDAPMIHGPMSRGRWELLLGGSSGAAPLSPAQVEETSPGRWSERVETLEETVRQLEARLARLEA